MSLGGHVVVRISAIWIRLGDWQDIFRLVRGCKDLGLTQIVRIYVVGMRLKGYTCLCGGWVSGYMW